MNEQTTPPVARTCRVIRAGLVPYTQAWEWQRHLAAERSAGRCEDTLLLLEHPPTITLGRAAERAHILADAEALEERGVAVVETNRGGDVTYHAPGQLVGYPIVKLSRYRRGLLAYLRALEHLMIEVLAGYGVAAGQVDGLTGVWVDPERATSGTPTTDAAALRAKIASIGVHLSASGVTTHGFALNVSPDLAGFEQIVPCGVYDRGITSLEQLLGTAPTLEDVADRAIACFGTMFDVRPVDEDEHE